MSKKQPRLNWINVASSLKYTLMDFDCQMEYKIFLSEVIEVQLKKKITTFV